MDNDHVLTPSESESGGITRRQMLMGTGALAAGYTLGQLATGASRAFADPGALTPADMVATLPFEWPTEAGWTAAFGSFENAAREGAIRSYERYRIGGG